MKTESTHTEEFLSERGLQEFVEYIDSTREQLMSQVIHITGEKNGVPVEVAMTYNTSFNENDTFLCKQY